MEPVRPPRAGVLRLGEPMVRPRRPRYRARLTPEAPFAWDFQTYRVVNKLCNGFQQVGSEVLHMLRGLSPTAASGFLGQGYPVLPRRFSRGAAQSRPNGCAPVIRRFCNQSSQVLIPNRGAMKSIGDSRRRRQLRPRQVENGSGFQTESIPKASIGRQEALRWIRPAI
jgi:hypothetical protein